MATFRAPGKPKRKRGGHMSIVTKRSHILTAIRMVRVEWKCDCDSQRWISGYPTSAEVVAEDHCPPQRRPSDQPHSEAAPPLASQAGSQTIRTTRSMPVDDLLYSQRSISGCFTFGETFEQLIGQLQRGERDTHHPKLTLKVLEYHDRRSGRLISHSLNNRRLWCLKEFQERDADSAEFWIASSNCSFSGWRHAAGQTSKT